MPFDRFSDAAADKYLAVLGLGTEPGGEVASGPQRKAVAAVGYSGHCASLPSAAVLGYPVILTKLRRFISIVVEALKPARAPAAK